MKHDYFLRAPGNYDVDAASNEAGLKCMDESLAQQQFREECDINEIVRRFGLTGEIPGDFDMPVSGDFTDAVDFHTSMDMIRKAQESFDRLPAEVRSRFSNDPGRLMTFLEDKENKAEALKLGLLQPPPEKTRDAVQAIDELATKFPTPPPGPPATKP
jgi:phage internal scaffolding protein